VFIPGDGGSVKSDKRPTVNSTVTIAVSVSLKRRKRGREGRKKSDSEGGVDGGPAEGARESAVGALRVSSVRTWDKN
jgi:hypothetical protein